MSRLKLAALPLDADDKSPRHAAGLRGEPVMAEESKEVRDGNLYDGGHADPNDPTLVAVVEHMGVLRTIRLTKSGSKVRRFRFETAKDGVPRPTARPWWQFAFIPGQEGGILVVQAESRNLLFTTLPQSEAKPSLVYLLGKHSSPVTTLTVSCDGSVTATGTEDGSLAIWALDDGRRVASMKAAHDGLVRCIALSGNETLVSAGRDGVVRVWGISNGGPRLRMMHRFASEQLRNVVSLTLTQKAPEITVAAGSSDGCLHVWRVNLESATARLERVLDHNSGLAITCLSFRGDGKVLALGTQEIGETIGKGTVQLFDTKSWSTLASQTLISPCLTCDYLQSTADKLLVCTPQTPPQVFEGALEVSALRRHQSTPTRVREFKTDNIPATAPQVNINEAQEEEVVIEPLNPSSEDPFDVEEELRDHMATIGITDPTEIKRLAEAHIHAMAAAKMSKTIPRDVKVFPTVNRAPEKVTIKKDRAQMRLDPKWLKIRDLGPKLEDVWVFNNREEQVVDTFGMRAGTLLRQQERGVEF